MEEKKPNPFRVMIDPRGFMRSVLLMIKPLLSIWVIASMGLSWLFSEAYAFSLGYQTFLWATLLGIVVLALPIGYLITYVCSFLLYWMGKIFNGKATFDQVYKAFVWSRVPEFFIALSWIGFIGLYGNMAFTPDILYGTYVPITVVMLFSAQLIFSVWETVILFHTLGEVQGFSAWIAVWNVLFVWVILMLLEGSFHWILAKGVFYNSLAIKSFLHL